MNIKKIIKRSLLTLIGGPLFLLFVLVVINLRDTEPSTAAKEFQQLWNSRAAVKNADNAYVYILGFGAQGADTPLQFGEKRAAWLAKNADSFEPKSNEFPEQGMTVENSVSEETSTLWRVCPADMQKCAERLVSKNFDVTQLPESEKLLLNRYQELIQFSSYREELASIFAPMPDFAVVMQSQRLLMLSLLNQNINNAEKITAQLNQDQLFWRMVLKNADSLFTKMIAVGALRNHYLWLNRINLNRVKKGESQLDPELLFTAFTADELSLKRCLIGEWVLGQKAMDKMNRSAADVAWPKRVWQHLSYKPQDDANLSADSLSHKVALMEVPIENTEAALTKLADENLTNNDNSWFLWHRFYNPNGYILSQVALPAYASYFGRTTDLENYRRGVVASLELMKTPSAKLDSLSVQSLYASKPWELDETYRSVLVQGLGKNAPATPQAYQF